MNNSSLQNRHPGFSGPRIFALLLLSALLVACKHPLEIEGQGDIVERINGIRGCALEEFEAGFSRCTSNEIFQDETAQYQALPRPGWKFSHWDGACAKDSPAPDCKLEYSGDWAELWDDNYPEVAGPPLKAVFVESSEGPAGSNYITSSFGITNTRPGTYSSLLDALFSSDSSYRYTSQQASTRSSFDRSMGYYQVQSSGLLLTGKDPAQLSIGGASTAAGDLLTLVDTDASDEEISVAYLMPERSGADGTEFFGTYYCGHIATEGVARFSKIIADANGGGIFTVLQDRLGASGNYGVGYKVFPDGTMTMDYAGVHLVGSLSTGGAVLSAASCKTPPTARRSASVPPKGTRWARWRASGWAAG